MLIAGRYRLQDALGRGAMGEVWRAFDETLGRPVAVKLLLPQDSDPTAASRFRLEAQTAGRLNHPHVVGVLDFGEHEGRLFLVMELVEGDSLARVLATSGPLPAERTARIAAQAAAGLAAAHRQGIVHRDIKPANLLLDTDGTLKIGDFGIARFLDDPGAALTATGQIVGTSLYLAPERALGRTAGPASDVYSLGCVLYQLLTGRPPFQADAALAVLHQHLDAAPIPPQQLGVGLPPAFESYLLGLLAKEPEDRPTAEQVADWFRRGAWRGAPEPLPQEHQGHSRPGPQVTGPGAAATAASMPGASVPSAPAEAAFVPVADTDWQTSAHQAAPRRSRLPFLHRSRLAAVLGGVALFTVALLVGLSWFSPGTGSAQGPQTGPSTSTSPATSPLSTHATSPPSRPPGTTSSPPPSPTPPLSSSPAQPAAQETEKVTDAKPSPNKAGKREGKGKH
ncbi:protein kinase [Streptomyces sp. ISL-22]|uniref:serine/threonine-protein kinase n=1 Tax=unclassified Streptomyces TaxID=2593676 RepID=UPI001BE5A019|nr:MULTISPECIES: serine/threonine-protein kinase [unclassified Streptomyces]MBT2423245.1 protein kinase [Streptomyces sp. ISL-24]MBT2434449.1 protein kinase [Streptomyces sp. ISL-22]